jgi:molybdate transport system substrate-binding protein
LRAPLLALLLASIALAAPVGCGGGDGGSDLTVSAASSLTDAFTQYGNEFRAADTRFSFGGSDVLVAQIEQGARPDVFASANTDYPEELHNRGLAGRPVDFATNRLVIAVPANQTSIRSVSDLAEPGVTIAIGSASVPIGSYTRQVLSGLGEPEKAAILSNVGTQEPDVAGIVGKLTQGAVDAGFTYATDVDATNGELEAIDLPARLQPSVTYAATVIEGTDHVGQARAFIHGLLRGPGAQTLHQAGFGPPPQ